MKKNVFYSVMAMFMMLFVASCSQDEIVSVNQPGDGMVRLSVNVSGATPNTRANVKIDGYTMRCIMEILDAENARIGEQKIVTVADDGTAHFEFEKPEGASKYLFWADYTNDEGEANYNTESLQKIGYLAQEDNNLHNNAAMDAFCASVTDVADGVKITLKRPFTRLTIKMDQVDELGLTGLDQISPRIFCGNNFNVATGTVGGAVNLRPTTGETVPALKEGEFVYFCYVFPLPSNNDKESTIKFASATNTEGHTVKISADKMHNLKGNTSVVLVKDEQGGDGGDDSKTTNVDVEIDNSYGQEDVPIGDGEEETPSASFAVGDYINAAGEVVTDAAQAVAVVFHVGAGEGDTPAAYGESFANKTIVGYAVALTNGSRGTFGNGDGTTAFPTLTGDGDFKTWTGFTKTAALEEMIGDFASDAFAKYDTWVAANSLSGENLSPWYIPSFKQLQTFCDLTFGDEANAAFAAKLKDTFTTGVSKWFYISSTIRDDGQFAAATINQQDGTCTTGGANPQPGTSTCIRAIVTIFE